jgi:hypothetical protein
MRDQLPLTLQKFSTWVVFICCSAVWYWMGLPADQQQELMAAYPWLRHVAPAVGFFSYVLAKAKPQGIEVPKVTSAKDPTQEG